MSTAAGGTRAERQAAKHYATARDKLQSTADPVARLTAAYDYARAGYAHAQRRGRSAGSQDTAQDLESTAKALIDLGDRLFVRK